jgi:hypothetical protein
VGEKGKYKELIKEIIMKYYRIHGADNNSSLYINNKELLEYCPKCGLIINRYEAILSSIDKFVLKKKKYNFSFCLEGEVIVSQRFVDIYMKYQLKGLSFLELPKSKGFYLLQCNTEMRYDYENNPNLVRRLLCSKCHQYFEVSCALPIKLLDEDLLQNNAFYKTDLIVGGVVGRWPLILATDDIPYIFNKLEKVKDVYFDLCNRG